MANFNSSNITTSSARLFIEGLNTSSTYTEVYITFQGITSPNLTRPLGNSVSLYWERTGLSPGTTYNITYTLKTSAGSTGSGSGSFTTLSPPPPSTPTNFRLYDNQASSLSLAWNTVSGADRYVIEVYHASSGAIQDIYGGSNYQITGGSFIAYGLVDGVTYNVKLYASNTGGNSSPTWLYSVRAGKLRPANFAWVSYKTRGASYSISNSRVTNLITSSEVVALQTRINEFRLYKGLTSTSFPTRSTGEIFTSTMYNQLKNAITAMSPPTAPSNSSNLIDLLNGLSDSLNSIT